MQQSKQQYLKKSLLTKAIQQLLYKQSTVSMVILGASCLMNSTLYAAAQPLDATKENMDQAIIQQEQAQSEHINETLTQQEQQLQQQLLEQQQQQALLDAQLAESLDQFATDQVYSGQDAVIPDVDPTMVNEIYQIAEQAQNEAQQHQQANAQYTVESVIQQQSLQAVQEQNQTAVQENQVNQLVSTLSQDKIELPVITKDTVIDANGTAELVTTDAPKRTWLDRLLRRDPASEIAMPEKLPKINVAVTGADEVLENNIEAMLSNFTVEAFADFNAALPQLRNMTKQAAEAVGYYQAKFEYQKIDENSLRILATPNQPVKVTNQTIEIEGEGKVRPAFRVIPVVPDLAVDDVLNHGKYETTKDRISNAASDLGYFDGYWRMHDVKVNLPENTADIQLKYETETRYQLHDVEFRMVGEETAFPLRPEVLKKLVPFEDNDDYSNWRINGLTSNLTNSRYFNYTLINVVKPDPVQPPLELPADLAALAKQQQQQAELLAQQQGEVAPEVTEQKVVGEEIFAGANDNATQRSMSSQSQDTDELELLKEQARTDKKIPVIVYLNADDPNNLEAGIGYGTDTGVRLRTQYRRAIVNDRGHSFDANLELSRIRQSIDSRYMIPYNDPLNDYISLIGGYEREERDQIGQGIELNIESAVLGAERVIKRPLGSWQQNMSVRYRLDRIDTTGEVDEDDIPDAFKIITASPEQESLLFGYEISKTTQNNRANPTQGFRQFYRVEAGSESLLTETDLAIINAGWRFIYSLGDTADHQFVGRGDLGYILTNDFDQVPYNLRYFAGGDQSIRGYDYKSLSPREDQLLLGGQALAVGSLEYNYQFKEGWRGAVFADVGNAYDEKFSNDTKYGVGVGVRWASPVGPIRIDVGAGISETNVPIRLHFFIGPAL